MKREDETSFIPSPSFYLSSSLYNIISTKQELKKGIHRIRSWMTIIAIQYVANIIQKAAKYYYITTK
jgi:hypothetical protein